MRPKYLALEVTGTMSGNGKIVDIPPDVAPWSEEEDGFWTDVFDDLDSALAYQAKRHRQEPEARVWIAEVRFVAEPIIATPKRCRAVAAK